MSPLSGYEAGGAWAGKGLRAGFVTSLGSYAVVHVLSHRAWYLDQW